MRDDLSKRLYKKYPELGGMWILNPSGQENGKRFLAQVIRNMDFETTQLRIRVATLEWAVGELYKKTSPSLLKEGAIIGEWLVSGVYFDTEYFVWQYCLYNKDGQMKEVFEEDILILQKLLKNTKAK
jgi:hypothetical protein